MLRSHAPSCDTNFHTLIMPHIGIAVCWSQSFVSHWYFGELDLSVRSSQDPETSG